MLSRALAKKLPDITFLFDELAALFPDAGITVDLRPYFESGGQLPRNTSPSPSWTNI